MKQLFQTACIAFLTTALYPASMALATLHTFPVNPVRELDFADLNQVFGVRQQMLRDYPIFFSGTYEPTGSVFAQVESGKPWWGTQGLLCYGPGNLAIEGPSEESRFIDNPFVLIGISEANAYVFLKEKGNCPTTYERPQRITFDDETMTFTVEYSVSPHEKNIRKLGYNTQIKHAFEGRNAIDFGVPYVHLLTSKNIHFENNTLKDGVYQFKNFIHVGGSCGYPGGCNNGSPYQPELVFSVDRFPASANFKLWKNAPSSFADPADLTYQLKIH